MIYILGSTGQLGNELRRLGFGDRYLGRNELDVSNLNQLEEFLKKTNITTLINASAYTAVDKAEEEKSLAVALNAEAPALMARYASLRNFKLIHYSTDYVFDGGASEPYQEDFLKNPINTYGMTKLQGENAVSLECPNALILRTAWVYSSYGKNFIKTILKAGEERSELRVVYDQIGTLTAAEDLAEVTRMAVEADLQGIYHYSGEGVSSWYDIAVYLKKKKKFKADITPILSNDYPTPAKRPFYSVLDKAKIKRDLNLRINHWSDSLDSFLKGFTS